MIIIIIPRPTIQTRPPSDIHHLILAHSSSLRTNSGSHPCELFGLNMLDKLAPGYSIVLLPGGLEWRVDQSHPNFNGQLRAGMAFPCILDIIGTSNTDLCIKPHSKFDARKTPGSFLSKRIPILHQTCLQLHRGIISSMTASISSCWLARE